jgi:hypothetical protein
MIAGVDYDTNRLAVCILDGDGMVDTLKTMDYRGTEDAFYATPNAFTQFMFWLTMGSGIDPPPIRKVHVWWIEHAHGRGPVDFKLGRVQGVIVSALSAAIHEPAVNEVGPPEWKKGVGLKGNAGKAEYVHVLRQMIQNRGVPGVASEHELDAFGIALYGQKINSQAFPETA